MPSQKRVLFVAHEISPYLELTEFAELINKLIVKSNSSGFEVRCIMPRFNNINERRHKLHEVLRLTGISVHLGPDEYPLQIKVASLGNARVQVYFLENEDLFKRDDIFHHSDGVWQEDNGIRSLFFCKGIIETVKKFSWPPDIIYCSGWMSSFIPLLIKKAYKKEPTFMNSHIIYSICKHYFDDKLESNTFTILQKEFGIEKKDLEVFKDLGNLALMKGGANFADSIMLEEGIEKDILKDIKKIKSRKVFEHKEHQDLNEVIDFFHLISK